MDGTAPRTKRRSSSGVGGSWTADSGASRPDRRLFQASGEHSSRRGGSASWRSIRRWAAATGTPGCTRIPSTAATTAGTCSASCTGASSTSHATSANRRLPAGSPPRPAGSSPNHPARSPSPGGAAPAAPPPRAPARPAKLVGAAGKPCTPRPWWPEQTAPRSLHCFAGEIPGLVVERLSKGTTTDPTEVRRRLTGQRRAVLGARPNLIRLTKSGIAFNPRDEDCVACVIEVAGQRTAAHDGNRLQCRAAGAGWMTADRLGTQGQKVRLGLGGRSGSATVHEVRLGLLVGVPRDLEEMAIGIGEVPGVDAKRAHMGRRGQRASGGLDLPQQLVDLCP
jgi:hypothetical protein